MNFATTADAFLFFPCRMPGVIIFRRRWSVGSDDFVVPGLFLFTIHLIWWVFKFLSVQFQIKRSIEQRHCFCFVYQFRLIILSVVLLAFEYDKSIKCIELLWMYVVAYICLLFGEFFDVACAKKLIKRAKIRLQLYP